MSNIEKRQKMVKALREWRSAVKLADEKKKEFVLAKEEYTKTLKEGEDYE